MVEENNLEQLKSELKKLDKEYTKVCDKLEILETQAFDLEQEMRYIERQIEKNTIHVKVI